MVKKPKPNSQLKPAEPDARSQAEKFAETAREHGADGDEEKFKGVLRKLSKTKAKV